MQYLFKIFSISKVFIDLNKFAVEDEHNNIT